MVAGTKLIYNGIALEFVRTRDYTRTPVWDESGTDLLWVTHRLTVDCLFNAAATAYEGSPPEAAPGTLPAVTDEAIRQALMEPRQLLILQVGDDLFLHSPPVGSSVDANNGPRPLSCSISRIDGHQTMHVSFSIETDLQECPESSGLKYPFVSSRWTQSHSVSDDLFTTITTSGVAVFRSDLLEASAVSHYADAFRDRVIPGIPKGFQRKSIQVSLNPSGTRLIFSVVDQEMPYSLGGSDSIAGRLGVHHFTARQTATTVHQGPLGLATGQVVVGLEVQVFGTPESLRGNLLKFAYRLVSERLRLPAGPIRPGIDPWLNSFGISEELHARTVSVHASVRVPGKGQGDAGASIMGTIGEYVGADLIDLLANDGENPQPRGGGVRGTWSGLLLAQAIQSSCQLVTTPPVVPPAPGAANPALPSPPPAVQVNVVDDLDKVVNKLSRDHTDSGTYTDWYMDIKYRTKGGRIACPVAGPTGAEAPEILQLCNPMTEIEVSWTAERIGRAPKVPDPRVSTPGWSLLDYSRNPLAPPLGPDAETRVYRISGVYQYVFGGVMDPDSPLAMGAMPWASYSYEQNAFPAESFVHGILDSGSGGTTPPGAPQGEEV
jgi:hypothetical protein